MRDRKGEYLGGEEGGTWGGIGKEGGERLLKEARKRESCDGGRSWQQQTLHKYSGRILNRERRNKADGIHVKEQSQSPSKNKKRKENCFKGAQGTTFIQLAGLSN